MCHIWMSNDAGNASCLSSHYGVATIRRLLKIVVLFCRISSVFEGVFTKETYHLRSLLIVATTYGTLCHTYDCVIHRQIFWNASSKLKAATRTLQQPATHCDTLRHFMSRVWLSHVAYGWLITHYKTLQHIATHCNTLQHTATHGNTLQHIATHYNTHKTTHNDDS